MLRGQISITGVKSSFIFSKREYSPWVCQAGGEEELVTTEVGVKNSGRTSAYRHKFTLSSPSSPHVAHPFKFLVTVSAQRHRARPLSIQPARFTSNVTNPDE